MRAEFLERVELRGPEKPPWIRRPYYELRRIENVVLLDGRQAYEWHWCDAPNDQLHRTGADAPSPRGSES